MQALRLRPLVRSLAHWQKRNSSAHATAFFSSSTGYVKFNVDPAYAKSVEMYAPQHRSLENYAKLDHDAKSKLFSSTFATTESPSMIPRMEYYIRSLQDSICSALEAIEAENASPSCSPTYGKPGAKFRVEEGKRDGPGMLGGSSTRVLQDGAVFEKAGVNTSVIAGKLPYSRLKSMRADHAELHKRLAEAKSKGAEEDPKFAFRVAGISLVLHPHNPKVPTVHANYRLFELDIEGSTIWWYGGGSDLTPTYVVEDDARHFHNVVRAVCDAHDPAIRSTGTTENRVLYPRFKAWCDKYFYLPHRGECRGIGGLFFDDLDDRNSSLSTNELTQFVTACGDYFNPSYFPIVRRRVGESYTPEEKRFQQLRRGRYVEFNVMYDRGTKFGLETMPKDAQVRTEAILMSLPLTARWEYRHEPDPSTPEGKTLEILRNPVEWL